MNCYGTVKIYKVDKSYRVKEKGTKRYEIKTHRDERKWKYKLKVWRLLILIKHEGCMGSR